MKKYYRNCDELPVYNFYKIIETVDYSYLYLDYDEYNQVKIDKDIAKVWDKIYEEYLKLTENNTAILYYEVVKELLYLKTRYNMASSLLVQLSIGRMSDSMISAYAKELKTWRYVLDIKKPLKLEVERLLNQLKSSQNKIRLKETEKEGFEKNRDKETMTLIEQQVKLEQALDRNEIDTKKTVVTKWLAMIKELKLINEHRKKKNGKSI